jgi:hypothetical protein
MQHWSYYVGKSELTQFSAYREPLADLIIELRRRSPGRNSQLKLSVVNQLFACPKTPVTTNIEFCRLADDANFYPCNAL